MLIGIPARADDWPWLCEIAVVVVSSDEANTGKGALAPRATVNRDRGGTNSSAAPVSENRIL